MFRFTIRDVLWLTVVVALGVGWWLNSNAILRSERDAKAREISFLQDEWRLEKATMLLKIRYTESELEQTGRASGWDWPPNR